MSAASRSLLATAVLFRFRAVTKTGQGDWSAAVSFDVRAGSYPAERGKYTTRAANG